MTAPAAKLPELDLGNFEMVEAAVRLTERGRWFLDEFARRSRQRETLSLLAAMRKIENVVVSDRRGVDFQAIRNHIEASGKMIRNARTEIDKQMFPLDPSVATGLQAVERHLIEMAQMIVEGTEASPAPTPATQPEMRTAEPPAPAAANRATAILEQEGFVFRQ